MWELLVEIILFLRSKKHRTPIEILKSFIRAKDASQQQAHITDPCATKFSTICAPADFPAYCRA
jgi:hypothetical protein